MLPDGPCLGLAVHLHRSQCTYRCVVLPDEALVLAATEALWVSQCTYRCVVLPDTKRALLIGVIAGGLNAPTGAWCSLTLGRMRLYALRKCLNAPTGAWCSLTAPASIVWWRRNLSQCTYRCVVLPDPQRYGPNRRQLAGLNAPTGAWCSLTPPPPRRPSRPRSVSMHLQVRGAP